LFVRAAALARGGGYFLHITLPSLFFSKKVLLFVRAAALANLAKTSFSEAERKTEGEGVKQKDYSL